MDINKTILELVIDFSNSAPSDFDSETVIAHMTAERLYETLQNKEDTIKALRNMFMTGFEFGKNSKFNDSKLNDLLKELKRFSTNDKLVINNIEAFINSWKKN